MTCAYFLPISLIKNKAPAPATSKLSTDGSGTEILPNGPVGPGDDADGPGLANARPVDINVRIIDCSILEHVISQIPLGLLSHDPKSRKYFTSLPANLKAGSVPSMVMHEENQRIT